MDYELIFWIAAAIASVIGFGILWTLAKKDAENYVDLEVWK
jgi:hypothetical protein